MRISTSTSLHARCASHNLPLKSSCRAPCIMKTSYGQRFERVKTAHIPELPRRSLGEARAPVFGFTHNQLWTWAVYQARFASFGKLSIRDPFLVVARVCSGCGPIPRKEQCKLPSQLSNMHVVPSSPGNVKSLGRYATSPFRAKNTFGTRLAGPHQARKREHGQHSIKHKSEVQPKPPTCGFCMRILQGSRN